MQIIQSHILWACRLNRTLVGTLVLLALLSSTYVPSQWSHPFFGWKCVALILPTLAVVFSNEILAQASKQLKDDFQRLNHFAVLVMGLLFIDVWSVALATKDIPVFMLLPLIGLEAQFLRRPLLSLQMYLVSLMVLGALGVMPDWNPLPFQAVNQWVFLAGTVLPLILPVYVLGHVLYHFVNLHYHQVETLQSLASTDPLTGLLNRRQFNARLQGELSRARRHQSPLSLALFDIDNFKYINDHYGHPVGDRILKEMGEILANNIRESDVAARYGGEEFALILPETKEREAMELLERLRHRVSETVFCLPDNPITLTVSVGVADLNLRQSKVSSFEIIERADNALYQAKGAGKNKVVPASETLLLLSQ